MVLTLFYFVLTEAFDPLDPTGNVTIRWDIMSWTSDGYMVSHFDKSQLSREISLCNYASRNIHLSHALAMVELIKIL